MLLIGLSLLQPHWLSLPIGSYYKMNHILRSSNNRHSIWSLSFMLLLMRLPTRGGSPASFSAPLPCQSFFFLTLLCQSHLNEVDGRLRYEKRASRRSLAWNSSLPFGPSRRRIIIKSTFLLATKLSPCWWTKKSRRFSIVDEHSECRFTPVSAIRACVTSRLCPPAVDRSKILNRLSPRVISPVPRVDRSKI